MHRQIDVSKGFLDVCPFPVLKFLRFLLGTRVLRCVQHRGYSLGWQSALMFEGEDC
jgi:hypothetical protein